MRKVALMLAVGVMAASTAVLAHDPPDELNIAVQFPEGNEPTIDGDCSEWDAVIPAEQYYVLSDKMYPVGSRHAVEGLARGEMDASSLTTTIRVGWSATTQMLYYCNSVFDDVHVIDRADSYDWYADDSNEYFFNAYHRSEQEVRDLIATGVATYWGFNYAVPKSAAGDTWMVISPCNACEWTVNDNAQHRLRWAFTGEEFGEGTYSYEHQSRMLENYATGLEAYTMADMNFRNDVTEGETIHATFFINDDDAAREDGNPASWSTGSGLVGGTWLGMGDYYLEEINPDLPWGEGTAVESQSWGRIKAQF
jgi:hypothetical protein